MRCSAGQGPPPPGQNCRRTAGSPRGAAGTAGQQLPLCVLSSSPVCAAAGRPPGARRAESMLDLEVVPERSLGNEQWEFTLGESGVLRQDCPWDPSRLLGPSAVHARGSQDSMRPSVAARLSGPPQGPSRGSRDGGDKSCTPRALASWPALLLGTRSAGVVRARSAGVIGRVVFPLPI